MMMISPLYRTSVRFLGDEVSSKWILILGLVIFFAPGLQAATQTCEDFFIFRSIDSFRAGEITEVDDGLAIEVIEKAGLLHLNSVESVLHLVALQDGVDIPKLPKQRISKWAKKDSTVIKVIESLQREIPDLKAYLEADPKRMQALVNLLKVSLPRYAMISRDLHFANNPLAEFMEKPPWMTHKRAVTILIGGLILGGAIKAIESYVFFGSMGWVIGGTLGPILKSQARSVYSRIRLAFRRASLKRFLRRQKNNSGSSIPAGDMQTLPIGNPVIGMDEALEYLELISKGDEVESSRVLEVNTSLVILFSQELLELRKTQSSFISSKSQEYTTLLEAFEDKKVSLDPTLLRALQLKIINVLTSTHIEIGAHIRKISMLKSQVESISEELNKAFKVYSEEDNVPLELQALQTVMAEVQQMVQKEINHLYNISQQFNGWLEMVAQQGIINSSGKIDRKSLETIKNEGFSRLSSD